MKITLILAVPCKTVLILSLLIESYNQLTLKVNFLCNIFGFDMSFLVANKYFSIFLECPALCFDPLVKFIPYKRRKKKVKLNCQSHMGHSRELRYRRGLEDCKIGGRSELVKGNFISEKTQIHTQTKRLRLTNLAKLKKSPFSL